MEDPLQTISDNEAVVAGIGTVKEARRPDKNAALSPQLFDSSAVPTYTLTALGWVDGLSPGVVKPIGPFD